MAISNQVRWPVAFSCLLAACGSSAGASGGGGYYAPSTVYDSGTQQNGQDAGSTSVQDAATTPGASPKFGAVKFAVFGDNIFPTYIAHLFGTAQFGDPPKTLQFVNAVTVNNPGTAPASVTLTAELQGFSFPATAIVQVPAGGSTTVSVPMTFKMDALYAVSATQAANVVLTLQSGGQTVDSKSKQIQIAPKNTVFWKTTDSDGKTADVSAFLAVMVTPHDKDKQIDKLLTAAAGHSMFNAMIGYQTLGKHMNGTTTVVPGDCHQKSVVFKAGATVDVDISVTCSACFSYNAQYYFIDDANHDKYLAGSDWQYILGADTLGSFADNTTIATTGTYWYMACNPASNDSDRDFTIKRTMGANEGVADQLGAIFLALREMGMVYTTVTASYFDATQNIKTPAESIESGSENCIDGTLVFASALESMGMEPAVVRVPGHAFVAVRGIPGVDLWWSIETTMVGGAANVAQAMDASHKTWADAKAAGTLQLMKIGDLRAAGINPGPF